MRSLPLDTLTATALRGTLPLLPTFGWPTALWRACFTMCYFVFSYASCSLCTRVCFVFRIYGSVVLAVPTWLSSVITAPPDEVAVAFLLVR